MASTLEVNGDNLITLRYVPDTSTEAIMSKSGEILVNITYDYVGRPTKWNPMSPLVATEVNYDDWGHITQWKRGELFETYEYDHLLRLISVTYADGCKIRYEFSDESAKVSDNILCKNYF